MKVPLRFQITLYDCATTSLINALSYLFEREEIPITLLKTIYKYTLDAKGKNGVVGEAGTSRKAIKKLLQWIKKYSPNYDFNIKCQLLEKEDVNMNKIRQCFDNNGCVLARCYQQTEHYVLITKIDDKFAYIFDPYYLGDDYHNNDQQVEFVSNQDFYNRIVEIKRLFSESYEDFSLMEIEKREVVLINKIM